MADEIACDLDYNVYLLDARGRIQARRRLHAASDECAVWVFTKLGLGQSAELWRRGRRIAAIDKDGEPQGSSARAGTRPGDFAFDSFAVRA